MKLFCLLLFLFVACCAQSQVVRQPLSVYCAGLGAYSKNFSTIFSATANLASLAQLKTASFGVYGERRFMLAELNAYSAVVAFPTASGTFGFQGDYFGSAAYNENQLGIMYARTVTKRIDAGVKFNYFAVRIPGYGNAAAVNFEAGAIFHLTDKVHTGFHIYNPGGSKLGKNGYEKLASVYRFGIGYEVSEALFIGAEIVKEETRNVSINAGLQYNIYKKVFIRTGISTETDNSYVSTGLKLNFARIDLNVAYHPQLGFTPGLLLLVNFKKKEKE